MANIELMRLWNTYLGVASDTLLDLGATAFRWKNAYISGVTSTGTISTSSVNATVVTATSGNVTSERFTQSLGSSLILSNSSRAYINAAILTTTAAMASGDVWFMTSSNRMYLAMRSGNFTYYAVMNT